ncbi:putative ankyrin repeat domain protein [Amniculicola lignicola CBS 123094]|uniref:Putative ankyrin repeat domain protein n=1 Tax=Amniculicola lignicola CBS 123094 TaxID=1392246 RepID=A0A6A5W272_9PLEO|nr:putative ankyrin repeat domain protein [Amniculicola lignicola CBS 123094]
MTPAPPKVDNSEYTVGWIAALPHERAAAQAMLDQKHAPAQQKHENDHNIYSLGSITGPNGEHNVAIASLPFGRYGITSAATVAMQMLSSFPSIKFGLVVGVGVGIPSIDNDIRLGDVVVSKPEGTFGGVRQYDRGKITTDGVEERGQLNSPPQVLLNAMGALVSRHEMEESVIPSLLEAMQKQYPKMSNQENGPGYIYQGAEHDQLFEADYVHDSSKRDCGECDLAKVVKRPERYDQNPWIHYGTIASGDQVIPDARILDLISKNCLCFETEAAGLMNNFPCLVIRGICDYSGSHQNDRWQKYAAATAAAYAKELLQITDVVDIKSTPCARDVMHEFYNIDGGGTLIIGSKASANPTIQYRKSNLSQKTSAKIESNKMVLEG